MKNLKLGMRQMSKSNVLTEFEKYISKNETSKNFTIGTVQVLIYSSEVFKNNKDIVPFLEEVFNQSYLPYVIKSRNLIAAKVGRYLASIEEQEVSKIDKAIVAYFELDPKLKDNKGNKSKKKNSNQKLDAWLRGI